MGINIGVGWEGGGRKKKCFGMHKDDLGGIIRDCARIEGWLRVCIGII